VRPVITFTSDFQVQSQGVGAMEATAYQIAPDSRIIHVMHGLPGFEIIAAARTLETLKYFPIGYHVCVCDPGVGTSRKALACEVARGDFLIGPDNGVLLPGARVLGGLVRAFSIENPKYMRQPVSPIFHGRDVFSPAAAHLANGVKPSELGPEIDIKQLVAAPYGECTITAQKIDSKIIQINRFGSIHLNIFHEQWDELPLELGQKVRVKIGKNPETVVTYTRTFGEVPAGQNVIMRDDYGRVEIAKNLGAFTGEFPAQIGEDVSVYLS